VPSVPIGAVGVGTAAVRFAGLSLLIALTIACEASLLAASLFLASSLGGASAWHRLFLSCLLGCWNVGTVPTGVSIRPTGDQERNALTCINRK
jgi:hypothetical protein